MSAPIIGQNQPTRPVSMHTAVGDVGVHFDERGTYQAWRALVEDEAPGLSSRLVTVYKVDGGCDVAFRLPGRVPLMEDGLDVLRDITRRLGIDSKHRGGRGGRDRPNRTSHFPPVPTKRCVPCLLLA